jgi:hypothetical protein
MNIFAISINFTSKLQRKDKNSVRRIHTYKYALKLECESKKLHILWKQEGKNDRSDC